LSGYFNKRKDDAKELGVEEVKGWDQKRRKIVKFHAGQVVAGQRN